VAAIETGRQYIGIDLLPEYVALANAACVEATAAKEKARQEQAGESQGGRDPLGCVV
jgi:DNA modification methylase